MKCHKWKKLKINQLEKNMSSIGFKDVIFKLIHRINEHLFSAFKSRIVLKYINMSSG